MKTYWRSSWSVFPAYLAIELGLVAAVSLGLVIHRILTGGALW